MERNTIIDGYNLILQSRFGRYLNIGGQLMRARLALIQFLIEHLDRADRARTVIVFDSKEVNVEGPAELVRHSMKIEFAIHHAEADDRIEELINEHRLPKRLRVVSSDHRLQRAVQRRGGRWIEPLDWLDAIQQQTPVVDSSSSTGSFEGDTNSEQGDIQFAQWLDFYDIESESISKMINDFQIEANAEVEDQVEDGLAKDATEFEKPDRSETFDNPFPPGYGEDLLDEGPNVE